MPLDRSGQYPDEGLARATTGATTIKNRRGHTLKEAASHFSWLAPFVSVDNPVSSSLTRQLLGWQSTRTGLIDDLDQGHYFNNRQAMTRRSEPGQTPARRMTSRCRVIGGQRKKPLWNGFLRY